MLLPGEVVYYGNRERPRKGKILSVSIEGVPARVTYAVEYWSRRKGERSVCCETYLKSDDILESSGQCVEV